MKHSSFTAPRVPDASSDPTDEGLFEYVNTLRLSVRAKVAAEQERGLSLSEIVVQVRTMVRLAEEDRNHLEHIPLFAFRAVSRQALAWCVEAYQPLLFAAGDVGAIAGEHEADPSRPVLPVTVEALDRFSSQSNTPVKDSQ